MHNTRLKILSLIIGFLLLFGGSYQDSLAGVVGSNEQPALQVSSSLYLPVIKHNQPPNPHTGPVAILNNFTAYTSDGWLHVVGQVRNNTNQWIYAVKVEARLVNSAGATLRTEDNYVILDHLAPGVSGCFDIVFTNVPGNWSRVVFSPARYRTGTPGPLLSIRNVERQNTNSVYRITGEIRNTSGSRVELVKAVATLYNEDGKVIGCSCDIVEDINLDNNSISDFDIIFFDRGSYNDVEDDDIQASGNPR